MGMVTTSTTITITIASVTGMAERLHDLAMASPLAVVRLLWLVSPALPIGSYAYSRGLEQAVQQGTVHDELSAASWIDGVLANQIATLDLPLLARLYDAFLVESEVDVERWCALSCALRESAETALEDGQLGRSLARVLHDAGLPEAFVTASSRSYVAAFALAAVHFGIAREAALLGYLYAFTESQVIACTKLVPLGQRAGQRVLERLFGRLEPLAARALTLPEDEIGAYTPGLALASALHETQYARLFRS